MLSDKRQVVEREEHLMFTAPHINKLGRYRKTQAIMVDFHCFDYLFGVAKVEHLRENM